MLFQLPLTHDYTGELKKDLFPLSAKWLACSGTNHSAYDATSTEWHKVKINGFMLCLCRFQKSNCVSAIPKHFQATWTIKSWWVKVAPFCNILCKIFVILHEYIKGIIWFFCKHFSLIEVGKFFIFLSIQSMILEKWLMYFRMRHYNHNVNIK